MSNPPDYFGLTHDFDFKLADCGRFALTDWKTQAPSDGLAEVHKNFRSNVSRVRNLILMHSNAALHGMDLQRWKLVAEYQIAGTLTNEPFDLKATKEIGERIYSLSSEDRTKGLTLRGRDNSDWDESVRKRHEVGFAAIEGLSSQVPAITGTAQILASYVTGGWTAFEALAGDLWETAINLHPSTLAALSGRQKFAKDRESKADNDQSKSVPLDYLQEFGFDVRNRMGTVLRRKFEFSRLSGIRRAYAAAFSKNASGIETVISSKAFDALSAVRNLLVHKTGIIDAEYLRRAGDLNLPKQPLGSNLRLDGEVVVSLIKPAFDNGAKLITAVDTWLAQNKT